MKRRQSWAAMSQRPLSDASAQCVYTVLYSTCVHFMVAGGDLFVTPPLWHPASVAVQTLSWPSLCVGTVVTPFSILWESSMTCAVHTLCFSFMLMEQLYVCLTLHYPILGCSHALLYVCLTLHYPILYFLAVAILYLWFYVFIPYSTLPYSWLQSYSISMPMWRLTDMCIPYTLSI